MEAKMVYVIDYGTGVKMTAKSLLMAKRTAGEFAGYTGKDIVIEDIDGNPIAVSHWVNGTPEKRTNVLFQFGKYGYYTKWEEQS